MHARSGSTVTRLRIVVDAADPDAVLVVTNERVRGGIPVIPTASSYAFWAHLYAPSQPVTVIGGTHERPE